jgi:hypothetical protein
MSDDMERQAGATDPDQPRQAATTPDSEYSLSIEEVGDLYAQAGLPRDLRTIQRYCRRGRLDARLVEFPYGEKYLITPTSIERHIAFLKELNLAAADRGEPRSAAAIHTEEIPQPTEQRPATTDPDQPRPVAAEIFDRPYVKRLEAEVGRLSERYERQVRRTEEVLLDANKRLIELQQANAIAQSETLAKYMLESRAGVPAASNSDEPASAGG